MLDELEARVADEVRDVVGMAGEEVVHPDHRVALGQEAVAQVRAEEAGRAGDEDPHQTFRPMRVVVEAERREARRLEEVAAVDEHGLG